MNKLFSLLTSFILVVAVCLVFGNIAGAQGGMGGHGGGPGMGGGGMMGHREIQQLKSIHKKAAAYKDIQEAVGNVLEELEAFQEVMSGEEGEFTGDMEPDLELMDDVLSVVNQGISDLNIAKNVSVSKKDKTKRKTLIASASKIFNSLVKMIQTGKKMIAQGKQMREEMEGEMQKMMESEMDWRMKSEKSRMEEEKKGMQQRREMEEQMRQKMTSEMQERTKRQTTNQMGGSGMSGMMGKMGEFTGGPGMGGPGMMGGGYGGPMMGGQEGYGPMMYPGPGPMPSIYEGMMPSPDSGSMPPSPLPPSEQQGNVLGLFWRWWYGLMR